MPFGTDDWKRIPDGSEFDQILPNPSLEDLHFLELAGMEFGPHVGPRGRFVRARLPFGWYVRVRKDTFAIYDERRRRRAYGRMGTRWHSSSITVVRPLGIRTDAVPGSAFGIGVRAQAVAINPSSESGVVLFTSQTHYYHFGDMDGMERQVQKARGEVSAWLDRTHPGWEQESRGFTA